MKKLLLIVVAILCVTAITVQAGDKKGKKEIMTPEQKQLMTDMLAKYDTNKDGKLDKTEKAAMSAEDKAAWAKAFPTTTHKKKSTDGDAAAPAAPAAPADK